jgi:hypothetical protein
VKPQRGRHVSVADALPCLIRDIPNLLHQIPVIEASSLGPMMLTRLFVLNSSKHGITACFMGILEKPLKVAFRGIAQNASGVPNKNRDFPASCVHFLPKVRDDPNCQSDNGEDSHDNPNYPACVHFASPTKRGEAPKRLAPRKEAPHQGLLNYGLPFGR